MATKTSIQRNKQTAAQCELCAFNNPKGTATAVIIQNGALLMTKRAEEPYRGMWDLPGGYMAHRETPEVTLHRELKEELGVEGDMTFITALPGTALWKEKKFAIISFFYLVDIKNKKITLNRENLKYRWIPIKDLDPKTVAFDSNQEATSMVKKRFNFDINRVKALVHQLDSTASLNEQSLYRAVLNGYVAQLFDKKLLIGMGWIFPRQTALRKQAVVEDMIVDEAYRGKGLGRALLTALVKWAKKEGVEMIELTSNPKRLAANGLYQKFGFMLHPTNHYLYKVE